MPEVNVLPSLYVWNIMRAVAGGMIYASAWLQIFNVGLTVSASTPVRARHGRRERRPDARSASRPRRRQPAHVPSRRAEGGDLNGRETQVPPQLQRRAAQVGLPSRASAC